MIKKLNVLFIKRKKDNELLEERARKNMEIFLQQLELDKKSNLEQKQNNDKAKVLVK